MRVGHRVIPFSTNRRMAAASAAVAAERNTIHGITEVDISEPRRLMREHKERTGETLSLTAYVVASLARAVAENPEMNSFRKGRKLILLDDVTISAPSALRSRKTSLILTRAEAGYEEIGSKMKWLLAGFLAASALHMAEEYFYPGGFMDVMKELNPSFAPFVSVPMAIVVNGLQLVLCVVTLVVGERSTILGISVAALLFLNGLVHVGGCIKARSYSPGIVTGILLYLPLSVCAYAISLGSGRLTVVGVAITLALGLAYQAIPIGYLALASAMGRRSA